MVRHRNGSGFHFGFVLPIRPPWRIGVVELDRNVRIAHNTEVSQVTHLSLYCKAHQTLQAPIAASSARRIQFSPDYEF